MNLEKEIKKACEPYIGIPVALSGGIDSSLLAALLKPKFVISVELPEGKHNEIEYAKMVANHLEIEHVIVNLDDSKFDESVEIAVKAIGRPIPHFNIFPLFEMYKKLNEMGVKEVVLGDGPDETMCGYARDLIINYLYKVYDFEAFKNYKPLIDKILPIKYLAVESAIGKTIINGCDDITLADIRYMRPDMDDMSNGIANYFGIKNLRPYQDNKFLDDFMLNLPMEDKINNVEYGKYALRKIAAKYLPQEIAWRKEKVGGPVYPVNKFKGWDKIDGEFSKNKWTEHQKNILQ